MIRAPLKYDRDAASRESGLVCGVSLAKQEFKEECDINELCRRFGLGYEMPQGLRLPTYGDFSHISDYHQAVSAIALARESFDELPAHVRERFSHDPGRFVDFCSDSRNRAELVSMGLIEAPTARLAVREVPPQPAAPSTPVASAGEPAKAV